MRILSLTASLAFAAAIGLAGAAPAAATPLPAGVDATLAGDAGLVDLAQYGHHHHHRRHHHHGWGHRRHGWGHHHHYGRHHHHGWGHHHPRRHHHHF